jgi:hypothetical protein
LVVLIKIVDDETGDKVPPKQQLIIGFPIEIKVDDLVFIGFVVFV